MSDNEFRGLVWFSILMILVLIAVAIGHADERLDMRQFADREIVATATGFCPHGFYSRNDFAPAADGKQWRVFVWHGFPIGALSAENSTADFEHAYLDMNLDGKSDREFSTLAALVEEYPHPCHFIEAVAKATQLRDL